jgi:UDPglucose--hexose-1-phosphate uridylyltransferase
MYQTMSGLGAHEVIIESPEHVVNMETLSEKQLEQVFHAYRDRILQLQNDKRWRSILIYKNQGVEAGATLEHIHSQLIALPIVPRAIQEEIDGAKNYHDAYGGCAYCMMMNQEMGAQSRMVAQNGRFIIFCPYASRFPYEIWILPKQHRPRFEYGSKEDYIDLARSLRETLIRLSRGFKNPPFNYLIHSSPLDETANPYSHWHMEILPKVSQVGGFEWGSGAYINSVAPEEAARHLREGAF